MPERKNFGAKVFCDNSKLEELLSLARTGKFSVRELTGIFKCGKTTLFGIFGKNHISIPNKGRFPKIYHCNDSFFREINEFSAYWLGFIAADGTLSWRDKNLALVLNAGDKGHLEKFLDCLNSNVKISYVLSNNSVGIRIYSKEIFSSLVRLGITPNKSLRMGNVFIPSHFSSHFIRGLFDGDGSLSGKRITHVQLQIAGYKPLLAKVQNILITKCGVRKVKIYPLTGENKAFRLQYTGSQIFKILDFLYEDSSDLIRLDRKYQKYLDFKRKFSK